MRWVTRSLTLQRSIHDERGPVQTLWANRTFEVKVKLQLQSLVPIPFALVAERIPSGVELVGGSHRGEGLLSTEEELELSYRIRPQSAGKIRFEGASILLADWHGFFQGRVFVQEVQELIVLPSLVNLDTHTSAKKTRNTLMPPGIHQLAAPGSGSELLDLRDYIPGDPPKTIAWKVSARRDKLITKEYESEVPIRCTLLVDASSSVCLGPPGEKTVTRLVEIAASTTQANITARDLTGLVLFDEEKAQVVSAARNRRHLTMVLRSLADASAQSPKAERADLNSLLALGYTFAQEVYPERMKPDVNRMPWWLPFFAPTPNHWTRDTGATRRVLRWVFTALIALPYLALFTWLFILLSDNYYEIPDNVANFWAREVLKGEPVRLDGNWEEVLPPLGVTGLGYWLLVFLILPVWLKIFRDALPMLFRFRERRRMKQRKRMAALLAQYYELGPGAIEMLFQEEKQLEKYLVRFLQEHRVPFTPKLHDERGRNLFASSSKLQILTKALLNAVGKGRDNELFVLLVDLLDLEDELDPLLAALQVVLFGPHRVMVLIPWPVDFPIPEREGDMPRTPTIPDGRGYDAEEQLIRYLQRVEHRRYVKNYHLIRSILAKFQVPVICAADQQSVKLILERMDRLRRQQRHPAIS